MQIYLYEINLNHLARPEGEELREQISLVQGKEHGSSKIFRAEDVTLEESHNIPSSEPRK